MADGSVTIDTKLNNDGFKSGIGKIGSIAKGALTGVVASIGAVTTAFAGMVTASVKARGDLEQSIGGVETLFKDSANQVIENANKAYKTAGMSANDYMQNVTSFSASLLQSVAGDTDKAAKIADMAMVDMSDNANKMGTDMASITTAYQGFAKQNYTMLDNLKLGYGGTKTEMERLLKDAQKLTGVKYDINNLSDVYEAIHVIQGELGITGTTALEAEKTLTGSIDSLKASWQNFLSGSGDLSQVVSSVEIAFENILRIVGDAVPKIIDNISKALPDLIKLGKDLIDKILTGLMNNLPTLMESAGQIINTIGQAVVEILPQLIPVGMQVLQMIIDGILTYLPQIMPIAMQIIQNLIQSLIINLPQIIQVGMQMIQQLIMGIAQMLPTLIPQAVECVITLVMGLLDNIDMIIDAGIQLIIGLAEGLIEALPKLIEKIPEIIEKLLSAIARNLPKLVEAGIKLIVMLAKGLIEAIPQLISKIPQIIGALLNGLGEAISGVWEIGKNIVKGLWEGIQNAWDWIINKVKEFANSILNGMMSALGIHSPSTLFRDKVGKNIALGVGEGFEDNISKVYRQMKSAVDFETQKLGAKLSTTAMFDKVININSSVKGNVEMDGNKVGRLVTPVVSKTLKAGGLA